MRELWPAILLGLALTAGLFYFGIMFSKSGDMTFSIIFFPYTSLMDIAFPNVFGSLATFLGFSVFFLQYPIYAAILGHAVRKKKFYKVLIVLSSVHVMFMCSCFALYWR